jgi:L-alanine-DL-glutamate epimerase-like enolase superfamily enzyme
LGIVRDSVTIYGSGGFTSYNESRLQQQLSGWVTHGITRVKMKVGSDARADAERVRAARKAIGPHAELFVDGNGAYTRKQALSLAHCFADEGVSWFEEPVSSDDLAGLALLVERAPSSMEIATGEYGYDAGYFARLIAARAADVVQVDVTRCGGITGFLQISALCDAHGLPMSAHCAPSLHVALGCAVSRVRHLEYFHDHVRIENELFTGVPQPQAGALSPDRTRPGLGLELKHDEAQRYLVERKSQRWEH